MSYPFIKEVLSMVRTLPSLKNRVLEAPLNSNQPNVLFFSPENKSGVFLCSSCNKCLTILEKFTSERSDYLGRMMYDLNRNCMLLSILLECHHCGIIYPGYDKEILKQSEINDLFFLSHGIGFTSRVLSLALNGISRGK